MEKPITAFEQQELLESTTTVYQRRPFRSELATRTFTVLEYMSNLAWNNIGKPVKPLLTLVTSKVVPKLGHQNILAPTIHCPTFPPAQFANSGTPVLPPSFTFSGCSVNVFTEPVMTSGTFQPPPPPPSTSTSFGLSQTDIADFSKF